MAKTEQNNYPFFVIVNFLKYSFQAFGNPCVLGGWEGGGSTWIVAAMNDIIQYHT